MSQTTPSRVQEYRSAGEGDNDCLGALWLLDSKTISLAITFLLLDDNIGWGCITAHSEQADLPSSCWP
jgi:hypothetical protein